MLNVLADAASQFLSYRGRWDEQVWISSWGYEAAQALHDLPNVASRAYAVFWIHYRRDRTNDAILWRDRFTEIWAGSDDKYKQANVKRMHALLAKKDRQNYKEAELYLQEILATYRDLGSDSGVAMVLNDLGNSCLSRSDYVAAEKYYLDALELEQKIGDKQSQALYSSNLGSLFLCRKQWVEARQYFEQGLTLAREIEHIEVIASAQYGLARVWEEEGRPDLALPLAQETLAIYERLQHGNLTKTRELVQRLTTAVQKSADKPQ